MAGQCRRWAGSVEKRQAVVGILGGGGGVGVGDREPAGLQKPAS